MNQYLHLIDGKLMVGGKKPYKPTIEQGYGKIWGVTDTYHRTLTAWRESLVEVKNLIYSYIPEAYIHQVEADAGIKQIFPPHQVQTSEPGRITKIL